MSASLALYRAKQAGVTVRLEGDKLKLEAASPAPSKVLELLSAYKFEIIELLRCQRVAGQRVDLPGPTSDPLSPHARAHTHEREPIQVGPGRSTWVRSADEAAEIERILAAAARAVPDPCRYDDSADKAADWAGEFEEPLSPEATDYGDEREHDAWLGGVPIRDLKS